MIAKDLERRSEESSLQAKEEQKALLPGEWQAVQGRSRPLASVAGPAASALGPVCSQEGAQWKILSCSEKPCTVLETEDVPLKEKSVLFKVK